MTHQYTARLYHSISACFLVLTLGCTSDSDNRPTPSAQWQKGEYQPSSVFRNFCAAPREGINEYSGEAFADRQGSAELENHFLRSWSHESYLWYDELPDVDPRDYSEPIEYFKLLKTSEKTSNGTEKDRFHFTQDEIVGDQFTFTGKTGGYGISWKTSNDMYYVAFVEPNSPASNAGIMRGMWAIGAEGILLEEISNEAERKLLSEALFSPKLDETYRLLFTQLSGETLGAELTAGNVTVSSVLKTEVIATDSGAVGYITFNSFNTFTAEDQLKAAFDTLVAADVTDLVLDLRYNGGGYIYIAAQLGWLISGDKVDADEPFAILQYNDKRPNDTSEYDYVKKIINGSDSNAPLPTLGLDRVYILTTESTASASEAIINGLRGSSIDVIQVGSKTKGKAHGFNGRANCGTRYFSIDFELVNGEGFGDYVDGFEPKPVGDPLSNKVTGCQASDDLAFPLGDPAEDMLSAALYYRANGRCPEAVVLQSKQQSDNEQFDTQDRSLKVKGELLAPAFQKNMYTAPNIFEKLK